MKRRLVQVPYHLGREDATLGTGPPLLAEAIGGETAVVERGESFRNEVQASMAVVRALAAEVRDTLDGGYHPVVLAGNCNGALGTVTGAGEDLGVVWLDAHGDFETDETTTSGFFDGFALAMLTGQGWTAMRRGLTVVPPHRVVHVGGRDFNPGERERMVAAGVTVVRDDAAEGVGELSHRTSAVYLHVDLDVLDPSEGIANEYAAPGGLSADDLRAIVELVYTSFEVRAVALTAYDPRCDAERRIPRVAASLVRELVAT